MLTILNVILMYFTCMYTVFYMYLHGYVHVHQYNGVAFTALC